MAPITHAIGDERAPIVIVEYGDLQCPYTARATVFVDDMLDRRRGEVRYELRHFPLTQLHPHAWAAALATEAAGRQGKFWEMVALLLENQQALADDDLFSYAAALELDLARFARDMASDELEDKVEGDFIRGQTDGVESTPSFVVNGHLFDGDAADLDRFVEQVAPGAQPSP